ARGVARQCIDSAWSRRSWSFPCRTAARNSFHGEYFSEHERGVYRIPKDTGCRCDNKGQRYESRIRHAQNDLSAVSLSGHSVCALGDISKPTNSAFELPSSLRRIYLWP